MFINSFIILPLLASLTLVTCSKQYSDVVVYSNFRDINDTKSTRDSLDFWNSKSVSVSDPNQVYLEYYRESKNYCTEFYDGRNTASKGTVTRKRTYISGGVNCCKSGVACGFSQSVSDTDTHVVTHGFRFSVEAGTGSTSPVTFKLTSEYSRSNSSSTSKTVQNQYNFNMDSGSGAWYPYVDYFYGKLNQNEKVWKSCWTDGNGARKAVSGQKAKGAATSIAGIKFWKDEWYKGWAFYATRQSADPHVLTNDQLYDLTNNVETSNQGKLQPIVMDGGLPAHEFGMEWRSC
ncbi:MAG: hypothetical protein EXX96DRAFT_567216 [Benjaminiella poitrasii]|nr:MAG: hypothetical protein EXX96DRAFT_567216 [Benjaminiella poitrasii]